MQNACSITGNSESIFFLPHVMLLAPALQAVCHKWPRSYAVAVCAQCALHYMDDISLTEEILLEPTKTALLVEMGADNGSNHQQGKQREPQLQASALPLSMSERQLSLPRAEPLTAGLSIQSR